MKFRVVLDTNIFVSGIFWEGNYCSQIIDAWKVGKITLVTSLEIIQELVETLKDFKIVMPDAMIEKWRNILIENSVVVIPTESLAIVKDDPDDNKFFEAAYAGKAGYIVSQDRHILKIGKYKNVKTIHPKEFMALI
ncbi:MAG: putative toxin-antitoxin system toxin component, PIN family [Nanoarchaeota archaeon]